MANEVLTFLNSLFGGKPAGSYIHVWTLKKSNGQEAKNSYFFDSVQDAVDLCNSTQDRNVWVGCGTRDKVFNSPLRGGVTDISGIPGLWLDVDIKGEAHKAENLPADEAAALDMIGQLGVAPTIVIHSGHGLQCWWLFESFWSFADEADREAAAELEKNLNIRWIEINKAAGCKADSVHDLARVLRVPGTLNFKIDPPVPAVIYRTDGPKYSRESLSEAFSRIERPVESEKPQESAPDADSGADYTDPWYWLARAIERANADNTRHDHGVWLACQLRDNCRSAGVSTGKCQEVINAYKVATEDNAFDDPYTDSEINSLYGILNSAAREPAGAIETATLVSKKEAAPEVDDKDLAYLAQTDLGNAERFLARNQKAARFCPSFGKWFVWDSRRWKEDETGEIIKLAAATVRKMLEESKTLPQEAIEGEKVSPAEKLRKHARTSESDGKINAMLNLARAWIGVSPDELDADPWLLNCQNGVLDLRTGELLAHRQDNLITKLAPVNYNPDAECPTWLRFLDQIFENNQDLIDYMQRAVGYAMTGVIREQCLFFLHGVGANGKSTFLRVIQSVLGDYARDTPTESLMIKQNDSISNDIARLKGARFVTAVETETDKRMAESLVKRLTGGDMITARFMRQEFFQFEGTFKIFLAANHKPSVRGTDDGIWRRIKMIPFLVRIADKDQDARLPDKLREEAEGIFAWAVHGCQIWRDNGLGEPVEVSEATSQYRDEQDYLGPFIDEYCVINPLARVNSADIYKAYLEYCENGKDKPVSSIKLGRLLCDRSGIKRSREGGTGAKGYSGIGLKSDYPDSKRVTEANLFEREMTDVSNCDPSLYYQSQSEIHTHITNNAHSTKKGHFGSSGHNADFESSDFDPDSEEEI